MYHVRVTLLLYLIPTNSIRNKTLSIFVFKKCDLSNTLMYLLKYQSKSALHLCFLSHLSLTKSCVQAEM